MAFVSFPVSIGAVAGFPDCVDGTPPHETTAYAQKAQAAEAARPLEAMRVIMNII